MADLLATAAQAARRGPGCTGRAGCTGYLGRAGCTSGCALSGRILTSARLADVADEKDTPDPDDQKARMKAALEAKKNRGGFGSAGGSSSTSKGKAEGSRAGGKREFRRKSGG